jgi:hypothetical protein
MRTTWRRIMKPKLTFLLTVVLSFTCLTSNSFGFSMSDLQILKMKKDCVNCDLSGVDLSGADLSGVDLGIADLTGANLSNADLSNADLTGADLSNADLTGANLTKARLFEATLSGVIVTPNTKLPTGVIEKIAKANQKRRAEEKQKKLADKKRLALEKKSLQGIQPETQKEFLNIVLSYRDKYKNSKNEIKKTLQRKKRIKSFKTFFENNLSFHYWVGEVSSMDTNVDGDASIGIIIDSIDGMKKNDSLVAELAKKERDLQGVVFAESKMNWLIPGGIVLVNNDQKIKMDDDLFDTIAEMEIGDKVVFSGSFELHPEEQTGRSKGWYVHTANPTEKGAMTSPVFVVGYSDIKKVNK